MDQESSQLLDKNTTGESMNELEEQINRFVNQKLSPPEFFNALLESQVFIVSSTNESDNFEVMAKVADERDAPMLPVFTSESRIANFAAETHPHRLEVSFRALIQLLPDQLGVVINLHEESVAIGPNGISRMKSSDGPLVVPGGMARLFAEEDDDEDDDEPRKPWWKFW